MQEGNYKGTIDTVFIFGIVYMILCCALVSKQFDIAQIKLQLLASGTMLLFVICGFLYFRFRTTVENLLYLNWRCLAYFMMLCSSVLFVFQAIYESAANPILFYIVMVFIVLSYFIALWLRLKNDSLNLTAALEDGRFGLSGKIDFAVEYRPLRSTIKLVDWWNNEANKPSENKKSSVLIALLFVLSIPFLHTVIGAYIIGILMIFMSLVAIKLLIHASLDWLFYNQLR